MSDPIHLLIPFAASSAPAARDALRGLRLPRLEQLLSRLQPGAFDAIDELDPEPPHERALARALGLDAGPGRTPWAAYHLGQSGGSPGTQAWAWITPCHWTVGMNQVLMQDPSGLALAEDHARALLGAMAPFFAEDGLVLQFDTPGRWLAHGDIFRDLVTASLERVSGRDVAAWMPESPQSRTLHRLQSEMQMLLYTHPVNDDRAAQGLAPVNSFWISGAGVLPPARSSRGGQGDSAANAANPPIVDTTLREAALSQDWTAWAQAWQKIDTTHGAELLATLARGEPVRLTLCGEQASQTFDAVPQGLLGRIAAILRPKPLAQRLESL